MERLPPPLLTIAGIDAPLCRPPSCVHQGCSDEVVCLENWGTPPCAFDGFQRFPPTRLCSPIHPQSATKPFPRTCDSARDACCRVAPLFPCAHSLSLSGGWMKTKWEEMSLTMPRGTKTWATLECLLLKGLSGYCVLVTRGNFGWI